MAPWIYLQFQWSPLSMLSSVLELQAQALISQILTFVARFGALGLCAVLGLEADTGVLVFAVVSAFVYLARMLWFMNQAGVGVFYLLAVNVKYASLAAVLVVIPWVLVLHFGS